MALRERPCGLLEVTRFTIRERAPRHNVQMQTFDLQTGGFTRFELFTAAAAIWLGLGFVSLFLEADRIVADGAHHVCAPSSTAGERAQKI